jgi:hypothetical protein
LAKRFTKVFHSNHFIDRGSNHSEVKPVHRADVTVQDFADVQSNINVGKRKICRFANVSTAASRARRQIDLLRSTLPPLSLAMKAHTGHDIASGLLWTYLGTDAGSRAHSGAVERGTVDSLSSVLLYADLRGRGSATSRPERQLLRC